ncbi:hypothetical protein [Streptomyces goshikiensis]|uniref:hypothetical protein n=1 Tax=Streptomyces goshikiensis TaxID=1942 RepID=UPI003827E477
MTWIFPRCGRCGTGHYAQLDRTVRLHCTNAHCEHWILPRELVDIDAWKLHDGHVVVRITD